MISSLRFFRILSGYPYCLLALAAFIVGLLFHFAFDPYHWALVAILCPCILLTLLLFEKKPSRALLIGFVFGLGIFGSCVSFGYYSIMIYGEQSWWIAAGSSLLVMSYLAIYYGLQAYAFQRFSPDNSRFKRLLLFPATWVVAEYARSYWFTGFPILLLGQSQTSSPLAPWIPVIGIYGLSFILVFIAALIVELFIESKLRRGFPYVSVSLLVMLFTVTVGLHFITWTQNEDSPVTVTLVQGNTDRHFKWLKTHVDEIKKTYLALTEPHWSSDLIVWPETAITETVEKEEDLINTLRDLAQIHRTTIIIGIPFSSSTTNAYYNAIFAVGMSQGRYFKQHLFPFSEYLPFWLEWLITSNSNYFLPGSTDQGLLNIGSMRIAPFICLEIAFNNIIRRDMPKANLIVTLSDDSWFAESLAPALHFQIAKAQSLQTGRYQLFATNNGITGIINDQGQTVAQLPPFKSGTLTERVYLRTGGTPWVLWGDMPILAFCFILFLWHYVKTRFMESKTKFKKKR